MALWWRDLEQRFRDAKGAVAALSKSLTGTFTYNRQQLNQQEDKELFVLAHHVQELTEALSKVSEQYDHLKERIESRVAAEETQTPQDPRQRSDRWTTDVRAKR